MDLVFAFDETNVHWTQDPVANTLYLSGVQNYMNDVLRIKGVVFVNDVLWQLRIPQIQEGQSEGWGYDKSYQSFIEFGIRTDGSPITEIRLTPDGDVRWRLDAYKAPVKS